ncbi:MAG: hypothetical protein AAF993_01260 [Pseudomonadota bacterium]
MMAFASLLKREWLEHKAGFLWGPLILLILLLLFGLTVVAAGDNLQVNVNQVESGANPGDTHTSRAEVSGLQAAAALLFNISDASDTELAYKLNQFMGTLALPFYWVLLAVTLFALVASLYDERKDHSVLFWKSMPVSDLTTVLGKLVFFTWLAPLLTLVAILAAELLVLTLGLWIVPDASGARLWAQSGVWQAPWQLLLGFVLHGFWILPIYAWLLMLSAVLPRAPLLWGIGGPWIVIVLERIFMNSDHVYSWIALHMSPLSLPYVSSNPLVYDLVGQFKPLAVLSLPTFWSGLIVAGVLLAAAVYLRGRTSEI